MALESFFRIGFLPEGPVTDAFDEFVSLLDTNEELPKYLRRSDKRVKILAESRNFGLRAVLSSGLNSYDYDEGSVSLVYDVDAIVHEDLRSLSPPRGERQLSWELSSWARREIIESIKYRADIAGIHVGAVNVARVPRSATLP